MSSFGKFCYSTVVKSFETTDAVSTYLGFHAENLNFQLLTFYYFERFSGIFGMCGQVLCCFCVMSGVFRSSDMCPFQWIAEH